MRLVVWVVSGLAALAFIGVGLSKLVTAAPDLAAMAQGVPVVLLRVAGAAEVLGALGLVLPAAFKILPILTPIAASGLVLTMIGATTTNIIIGEYGLLSTNVVLGLLAGFVAWARFGRYAIQHRQSTIQGRVE